MEKKRENGEKKEGKLKKGRYKIENGRKTSSKNRRDFFFFFFCLSFFKTTEICFGSTKMRIFYWEKAFHAGKKSEKITLPPMKNIPLMLLCDAVWKVDNMTLVVRKLNLEIHSFKALFPVLSTPWKTLDLTSRFYSLTSRTPQMKQCKVQTNSFTKSIHQGYLYVELKLEFQNCPCSHNVRTRVSLGHTRVSFLNP